MRHQPTRETFAAEGIGSGDGAGESPSGSQARHLALRGRKWVLPPFRRLAGGAMVGLALLVVGACSSSPPLALVASSPGSIGLGEQRVLMGLVDPDSQEFLASPDLAATADFTGPDGEAIENVPLGFLWAVPDQRGLYRAMVEFPAPGTWNVSITADGRPASEPTPLLVREDVAVPEVGEKAPAVPTRTAADHPLADITTDTDPDPSFYELSLDDALADDRPTVVVFATPAFCSTQTCGPALDLAKEVSTDHPAADFVHVEIYENLDAASAEDLVPVEAVDRWALPSEPWLFVTDSEGTVTARFEGTYEAAELEAALAEVGA